MYVLFSLIRTCDSLSKTSIVMFPGAVEFALIVVVPYSSVVMLIVISGVFLAIVAFSVVFVL